MAARSPEELALALQELLGALRISSPCKISLTGICYTAPKADALHLAEDSLAGRFALALRHGGIAAPVASIDGEVVINEQGRKEVALRNGAVMEPASMHKVVCEVGDHQALSVTLPSGKSAQTRHPMNIRALKTLQRQGEQKAVKAPSPSSPPEQPPVAPAVHGSPQKPAQASDSSIMPIPHRHP